jgi:transcription elongation factor Elf1
METTYNIPVQSIHSVHKHLSKLQKRANKAGQEVVFKFSFDDDVKTKTFDTEDTEGNRMIASYKFRVLRVQQDITVHEGWTPIAKLDVIERQMKCYDMYNKEIETLGDSIWTKHCDHCGHNKIVHTAFVMQNGDKFMKVGKGCMKELAPASAAQIAREFDIYALWSDYLSKMSASIEEGAGGFGGGKGFGGGVSVDYVYDKATLILAMRAALEITTGLWVTSKYSEYDRSYSSYRQEIVNKGSRTFDFIQKFLGWDMCLIPDQVYIDSVNADVDLVLQKYPDLLGEKLGGLKTFAASEKARAIDIFLVKAAQDIIKREAEKEKMRVSDYQGAVGSKVALQLQLVSTKHGQGAYGGWTLWIFKDSSGNMFKKFGEVSDRFKQDDTYKFTAPIKGFETYDDIKYTVLGGPLSKFKA